MLPQCDTAVERSEKKKVFPFATEIISRIRLKSLAICTFATTTLAGASSSFRLLTLFFAHFLEGFRTILVISSSVFFQKTLHATSINILFLWYNFTLSRANLTFHVPFLGNFAHCAHCQKISNYVRKVRFMKSKVPIQNDFNRVAYIPTHP